jgi:hypothetical protein
VRFLNLGGGFGIPTSPATSRSIWRRSAPTSDASSNAPRTSLPEAELVIELGRYLVARSRHLRRAHRRPQGLARHTFLVTDGGLHHHLAASGNFGQVIRKNYPVAIGNRMTCRRHVKRYRSSVRCARRSICWPTRWSWPRRTRGSGGDLSIGCLWLYGKPAGLSRTSSLC